MDGPSHLHIGRSLSLVIPAYNEEAGIRQAVEEADQALAELATEYEIIVVDDGSADRTSAIVQEISTGRPHIRLLQHQHNLGYSAALRTGFEAAAFERVAFTDADCQFHLADLDCLLSLTDHHPIAVGYRLDRQDPWTRRFFSWGYNSLVRTLLGTGVRDCDCALKVFRRDALRKLLPETPGFFVNTEMLTRARQLGFDVAEAGVRHRPRLRGASKVSLGDIPRTLATLLPFWWTRVMFPGHCGTLKPEVASGSRSLILDYGFWTILLVAVLLFFARIRSPLLEPDEARYAEIPRQMLSEGSWLVPVLHGQAYYHKPPLLYWLVMASYSIFGVEDWAARLIPCLASLALVLVSYAWGRCFVNTRGALVGALMLCLSSRFVYLGRMLTTDSLLSLWVVISLALAHQAILSASSPVFPSPPASGGVPQGTGRVRGVGRTAFLLSAFFCGLGLLTKGPVALVLVIVPVLACQMLDPRTARPQMKSWFAYLAIAVGVALPWYGAVAWQDPAFVREFFWTHHVVRFVAPIDHVEPFWFFIPGLILGMLPWTLLLPSFARFLMRRSDDGTQRRPPSLGFFLLAGLWCLLFFSLGGCKRPSYILPAMPPLALALGCYIDAVRFPAVPTFSFRRLPISWALTGTATFIFLLLALHQLLPGYVRKFSMRGQVRPNREISNDPSIPVICYPHGWDSVSFYLRRNDVRVYSPERRQLLIADLRSRPQTLVFVKSERYKRDLERALPASLEFIPLGRQANVTAGVVQHRAEAPSTVFAQR